ncbi:MULTISPECIES: hypothetical protein [unclassified Endozoicomonas]|uniref:hypothetical protein n=2 Tax=Endozoicomonas TaxID=305899 RepID=UPI00214867F0|nr:MULTISPECIES: hypothetical protein [unclassified Endozoicomonas]
MTEPFIVEFGEKTGFPNQSFSMKRHLNTFSDMADANGYAGPGSLFDNKRSGIGRYGAKISIIESTSWQWPYATCLLAAFELILIAKNVPISAIPYSSPDSTLFNPIEQQEVTSMLTQGDRSLAAIIRMFGSEHRQQQGQPSESSVQEKTEASSHQTGSLTSPLNVDYSDGNGGPQKKSHTLGLNCFAYPCSGICQFRPPSDSGERSERPVNSEENSTIQTEATSGQSSCSHLAYGCCLRCMVYCDPPSTTNLLQNPPFETWFDLSSMQSPYVTDQIFQSLFEEIGISILLDHSETQQTTAESSQSSQSQAHLSQSGAIQAKDNCQQICDETLVGEDGREWECGAVCKNARGMSCHKRRFHSGPQTCDVLVIDEGGQTRPCGRGCENANALSYHKKRDHNEQQICDVDVVREDGKKQRCGMVCKNALSLSSHKKVVHSGQQTCDETLVGDDGQPRPCGLVFKNNPSLRVHKSRYHTGQKNCDMTVVGEDGQQWPCGTVCKNGRVLVQHKSKFHGEQKICDVLGVREDGLQWACGAAFKSARALSDHKSECHSGQEICDATVIGKDGQQQPCGTVCKNVMALLEHKTRHRKRKVVDVNQE